MIAPETSSSQWKSSVDSKQHETWNSFRVKTSDFQSKLNHQSAKCISKAKIRDTRLSSEYCTWATRSGDLTIAVWSERRGLVRGWGPSSGGWMMMSWLEWSPASGSWRPHSTLSVRALSPRVRYKENFTALILTWKIHFRLGLLLKLNWMCPYQNRFKQLNKFCGI